MLDSHFHWEFMAYDGPPVADTIRFPVTVEVMGYSSEADARIAAEEVIRRDNYALRRVWECRACNYQQALTDSMQAMTEKV